MTDDTLYFETDAKSILRRRPEPRRRGALRPEVSRDYTTHDWLCSFDGLATIKVSQRTGREYVGCPRCHAFARPGSPPPLALQTDRTAVLRRLVAEATSLRRHGPRERPPDDLPF